MGGHKIQSKHTNMHLMGAKAESRLVLLCAGDRKNSGAVAFYVVPILCRK